ncbi:Hsp70 protein [Desulfacinum hydrothermale DSM 13146]|uniref:Hsp70 protein n=1 Tax=Desulfacinum hydrothermale DSM 13146 TaxID=1121390 RepID=A0A1W1XU39_9BACT|nr:Hsp70 family protein [Desulfacinum hydrothermale]SMC27500.1 Hsp70 protein [Desulfacinum hydrothermale DSM 13146]
MTLQDEPLHRYVVGIDLGTTNSAVAYVHLQGSDEAPSRRIRVFQVPQLVNAGEVGRRSLLPSFLYLPGPYDLPAGATALPWDADRDYAVGEFAREQGALVPGRLVSSAKSWLCHAGVDRQAPILPWGAGQDVAKVSPVEASARYLQHIREAWNQVMARGRDEALLEEQLVVVTVPASFDEAARELTVEAAAQAGLKKVVLLEEPLAAFYSWLARHEDNWTAMMEPEQIVLVCDVGGGTTDFSAIVVRSGEKGLRFDRLAVGDHLMLGGDNMDLTLARRLEMQLMGAPGKLDAKRWHQLCHGCRRAKEQLLAHQDARETVDVTVMGTGGKLIGGTLKGTLARQDVHQWILEGFFPRTALDQEPEGGRRAGITEFGLPYVQDPAVTRHLAAFWRRHEALFGEQTDRARPIPDFVLFNGGALIPDTVRNRILDVVADWFAHEMGSHWRPVELDNPHPDLAVALGAAYYGIVRLGAGVRVGAGTPRAYYVEVARGADAGPEDEARRHAVCLIPRGTEEGHEAMLEAPVFEVLTNRPATFQILTSHTRLGDRRGDVVDLDPDELTELPPIRTALRFGKKATAQRLPVQLATKLSEVGTLEVWCRSLNTPHQWRLRFDVRQQPEGPPREDEPADTVDEAVLDEARRCVTAVFSRNNEGAPAPAGLPKELGRILEMPKQRWSMAIVRSLADALLECRQGRSRSFQHEARWLNLLGYCLRPGYGDPVDEWRMREVWKLFPQGVHFHRQVQCRLEWWIFWRRVAGGLSVGQQWHLFQQLSPALLAGSSGKKKGKKKPALRLSPQEQTEAWMAVANLERLPAEAKERLGAEVLGRVLVRKPRPQDLWTLTRLGARRPFYGPVDRVVASETATRWVREILDAHPVATEPVAHAVVHLARKTGDRVRDLSQETLDQVAAWLEGLGDEAERFRDLLLHPESAAAGDEAAWLFGESLPVGLRLAES